MADPISIRGARENNLRSVDLDLPRGALIAFCGVSGSGKSSLAFDVIHAEGRRRLAETLGPRGEIDLAARPAVDTLSGLPPTVAVAQRPDQAPSARATVGTLTDIAELTCILAVRDGVQRCPGCDAVLRCQSADEILAELLNLPEGTALTLLAPMVEGRVGDLSAWLEGLPGEGFARVRLDGEIVRIEDAPRPDPRKAHDLEVVIDRLRVAPDREERIADAIRTALRVGRGRLLALAGDQARPRSERPWCGTCKEMRPKLEMALLSPGSAIGACPGCEGRGARDGAACPDCGGARLGPAGRAVRLDGLSLPELWALPATALLRWCEAHPRAPVLEEVRQELIRRVGLMVRCGLGYLSMDRPAPTLSAGELRRLGLARVAGAALSGVLYVLDEPAAGLMSAELEGILQVLRGLRDAGNTVLVVGHEAGLIRGVDWCVELGPGPGHQGGRIIFQGTPDELAKADTPTGRALSGRLQAPGRAPREDRGALRVRGLRARGLDIRELVFPRAAVSALCGPSGSGRSTVLFDALIPALRGESGLPCDELPGPMERVVVIDGGLAGGGGRGMVASMAEVWGPIRELFAQTQAAKTAGFGPSHFSLNTRGGRCEACGGSGERRLELGWLPELRMVCPVCEGNRFDRATLRVRFRGADPGQALRMGVSEARTWMAGLRKAEEGLRALEDVGLGYLPLGQSTASLSGGELQRLRIARDLRARTELQGTLYAFDEPSLGLHPEDTARLVRVLHRLADEGATVIALDNDPTLAAGADAVITL